MTQMSAQCAQGGVAGGKSVQLEWCPVPARAKELPSRLLETKGGEEMYVSLNGSFAAPHGVVFELAPTPRVTASLWPLRTPAARRRRNYSKYLDLQKTIYWISVLASSL